MRDRYLSDYMDPDKRIDGRGSPPAGSRGEDSATSESQETRKPSTRSIVYNYRDRPPSLADLETSEPVLEDGKLDDAAHHMGYDLEYIRVERNNYLGQIGIVRKGRIAYTDEKVWRQACRLINDCDLLVGLPSGEFARMTWRPSSGTLGGDSGATLSGGRQLTSTEVPPGFLPSRLNIVNEKLYEEFGRLRGDLDATVSHIHVAPFRSIVPIEKKIRETYELHVLLARLAVPAAPDNEIAQDAIQERETEGSSTDEKKGERENEGREEGVHDREKINGEEEEEREGQGEDEDEEEEEEDDIRYRPVEPLAEFKALIDGLRSLVQFLDTDLKDLVDHYRKIQAGTIKELPFSHLWYLFAPGQEVVTRFEQHWQACRVLQVFGGRKSLVPREGEKSKERTISQLEIECFSIEFDGYMYGPHPLTVGLGAYNGVKKVTELGIFPLHLSHGMQCVAGDGTVVESLADYLTERGKKCLGLMSGNVSHRRYSGLSLTEGAQFETVEEIESDIIIDSTLAYRTVKAPSLGGGIIDSPQTEAREEIEEYTESGRRVIFDDSEFIGQKWTQWSDTTPLLQKHHKWEMDALTETHRLLPARVYGYVLFSRKWYPLHVDLIEPVPTVQAGEGDGFERLVLPPGHRDIVRALVKTHARKAGTAKSQFDLVKGKGKGLIILLHGAPGVGKTSTAECVAANAGRPLFSITCGDLGGDTAQEVESHLDRFFELARKWNCVLLLDEADVFLSTRTAGNIKQNSLVSVFLRVLEYYSGILVLTTNRVGSFDEAVKSRVHCALYYPPLDEDQTFKVWQMNIDTLEKQNEAVADPALRVRFSRKEIEGYAREHWKTGKRPNRWNGRQIKNAFQSAIALAEWDTLKYTDGVENPRGPLLEKGHFKTVAGASRHFDQYLEKVRRADYIRVKETDLRDDNITNHLSDPDVSAYTTQWRGTWPKKSSKSRKGKAGKGKSKSSRQKVPEPSSSEESSSSSESESESSSGGEETSEEEEEVVPVPEPPKKKSGKKKKKKDRE
ncbi:hypothetical protein B0T19DRAFT_270249 [Cercophora scortea]|uniref:AAA+ ATPase domain-containing protein n=1 Tax=Cercophora scortea TaxID=314031 RepID=A0AAE0M508_9PEZI|nr:hypothetical protein B0T19DRAFT_270249 [Cercophora scortea]